MKMREILSFTLIECLKKGTENVIKHENEINELNVFPVPDGDTGSNMVSTLKGGIEKIKDNKNVKDVLKDFYEGCLYSSRGNSGIILSQFIKGIYEEAKNEKSLSLRDLARGFVKGYYYSWKAIANPVEGTILTVIKDTSKTLSRIYNKNNVFEIFKKVIESGYNSLQKTPSLLPILKEAGVVDAGGKGFLHFIEGFFYGWLSEIEILKLRKEIPVTPIAVVREIVNNVQTERIYPVWFIDFFPEIQKRMKNVSLSSFEIKNFLQNIYNVWKREIKNRYDVELILEPRDSEIKNLEKTLKKMGDSLIIAKDGVNLKIHIHTNEIEGVIKYVESIGIIREKYIQDMEKQREEFLKKRKGILIFVKGEGFVEIFKGLGAERVFYLDNPTYMEMEKIFKDINLDEFIIIPNNKRLCIMIKEIMKKLNMKYYLIENDIEAEGIYLFMEWNKDENIEKIFERMEKKLQNIKAYEVKRAIKRKKIGEEEIKEGDYLLLRLKNLIFSGRDFESIFKFIKDKIGFENILIFYGENVKKDIIEQSLKKTEIEEYEIYYGGQKNSILQILIEEET